MTSQAPPSAATESRPVRPRPRAGRWRALFFAIAVTGILAGVAWALLGSRFLIVRSIQVTGDHLVTRGEVVAVAQVPLGTPLIRVDTAAVARRIEGLRQVASATVSKDWPDRLQITVRERVPVVAVRMVDGGYDLLDPSGVIVRWSAARPAGLPAYTTAMSAAGLRGDPSLASVAAVLAQLPGSLARSVASVSAPAPDQVTLRLRNGVQIVWGSPGFARQKSEEITIMQRRGWRYMDVSARGTVVTR